MLSLQNLLYDVNEVNKKLQLGVDQLSDAAKKIILNLLLHSW